MPFQLKYMNVQMQAGGNDCGIFAIAFTTALVFAEQPVCFSFNQPEMRKHLHECFIKRQMSMFPVKRSRHSQVSAKRTEEVPVYCKCRMPELPGLQWIQCSKCGGWYHVETCVRVPKKQLRVNHCPWYCHQCL